MRLVVQRVDSASVKVEDRVTGSIQTGLLVFTGFGDADTPDVIPLMLRKLTELRIFSDPQGKINLSLKDVNGSILVVSQFTLYANCSRGRRPDFTHAAPPQLALELYELFLAELRKTGIVVETGIFGAHMQVDACNNGPFTIILDSALL